MFVKYSVQFNRMLLGLLFVALSIISSCLYPAQTLTPIPTATLELFSPPCYGRVNVSDAIIRESADVTSPEIARLPSGTTVTVVARQGDWVRIETARIPTGHGWILADLLVITQSPPTPTAMATPTVSPALLLPPTRTPTLMPLATPSPTPTPAPTATPIPRPLTSTLVLSTPRPSAQCTVTVGGLNLRLGPDTAYPVLTVVVEGQVLTPIARNPEGEWVKVQTKKGVEGWVAAAFIDCNVAIGSLAMATPVALPPTPIPPTPTSTPTPTLLPPLTPTPTPAASPSPSPSPLARPTNTPTLLPPPTPTPTLLPPPTPTPPPTGTRTPTYTPVATATSTPSQ